MSDPSYALQKAIVARLKATPAVTALIGARIYDEVPRSPEFPYATFGNVDVVPDEADCYEGADVYFDLHIWSREGGQAGAKRICPVIADAVMADGLTLEGHALVAMERNGVNYLRDPDGKTAHAVLSFIAQTEPA